MIIKLVSVGDSSATESEIVLTAAMNFTVVRIVLLSSDFKIAGVYNLYIAIALRKDSTCPLQITLLNDFIALYDDCILDLSTISSLDLCLNVIVLQCTKFRVNRTINRGDIAKIRFSIWRPSAILDLL